MQVNRMQTLLDHVASGQLSRRRFLSIAGASGTCCHSFRSRDGRSSCSPPATLRTASQAKLEGAYDYIVVGAGALGRDHCRRAVKDRRQGSGCRDRAALIRLPLIGNPSIWFYNVGGPLDWKLPIAPVPQLNNRKFNMALGPRPGRRQLHQRDGVVARPGARLRRLGAGRRKGWGFKDVLPTYKARRRIGKVARTSGAVSGGPVHIRKPGDPTPDGRQPS